MLGSSLLSSSKIDLNSAGIGDKCAAEAVAAMLPWSAPTLATLRLGYKGRRQRQLEGLMARVAGGAGGGEGAVSVIVCVSEVL